MNTTDASVISIRDRVFISRQMSKVLRHKAHDFGLSIRNDGYMEGNVLLNWLKKKVRPTIKNQLTPGLIKSMVLQNKKQRFHLLGDPDEGTWYIRANQGHSMVGICVDMREITDPSEITNCIHGTYSRHLNAIMKTGLNRMNRQHIHMAASVPGKNGVISGMRNSCDTIIYVDAAKAMALGIQFFISSNGVILSPGDASGSIPASCFIRVEQR